MRVVLVLIIVVIGALYEGVARPDKKVAPHSVDK